MCEAKKGPEFARRKVTVDSFPLSDHNLAVPATPGSGPIHTDETLYDALSNPYALPDYHYDPGGEMGSAVSFLIAVDLWQREPIIRKLYRDVSNAHTVASRRIGLPGLICCTTHPVPRPRKTSCSRSSVSISERAAGGPSRLAGAGTRAVVPIPNTGARLSSTACSRSWRRACATP